MTLMHNLQRRFAPRSIEREKCDREEIIRRFEKLEGYGSTLAGKEHLTSPLLISVCHWETTLQMEIRLIPYAEIEVRILASLLQQFAP